jgi:hypothetical protein
VLEQVLVQVHYLLPDVVLHSVQVPVQQDHLLLV